jgi:hypothetical protein
MVRHLLLCPLAFYLCACNVSDWWGEHFRPRRNVELSQSQSPCKAFATVVTGTEDESTTTFNCWKAELSNAWTHIQTEQKDSLTNQEIEHLIKSRIVSLPGDPNKIAQKVISAKSLLGLEAKITKEDFNSWINWADRYRATVRLLYSKWTHRKERITWKDARSFLEVTSSALRQSHWDLHPEVIAEKMTWVMNLEHTDFEPVMKPITYVVLDLLNMLCPFGKAATNLTSVRGANCIDTFSKDFDGASKWIEFLLNPADELSIEDQNEIIRALNNFSTAAQGWFKQQGFSRFDTTKWWNFALSLDIDISRKEFTDSLYLIQRWTRGTDEIMPADFALKVFQVIVNFQKNLTQGLPEFVNAVRSKDCANGATYWTECILKESERLRQNPKIDLFYRVRNLNYGGAVSPLTGSEFSKMMLYDALAKETIDTFDEDENGKRDGIIYANTKDRSIHEAIASAVRFADLWDAFISNIQSKWKSEPVKKRGSVDQFVKMLDQNGFAELITMTSELFVSRKAEESDRLTKIWEGILANFTNVLPSASYYLDQMSVTAIFSAINILPQFRAKMVELSHLPPDVTYLNRNTLMSNVKEWLKEVFPRTEISCNEFGYDKSCQIVIDSLIPKHDRVAISDLDIVSIYAMTLESILDTCDHDHDGKLSWELFNGNDELDCGFINSSEIAMRLIHSEIVKTTPTQKAGLKLAMDSINSFFLMRTIGKTALVRGTQDYMYLNLPFFWLYNGATIGSIHALIGDIITPQ